MKMYTLFKNFVSNSHIVITFTCFHLIFVCKLIVYFLHIITIFCIITKDQCCTLGKGKPTFQFCGGEKRAKLNFGLYSRGNSKLLHYEVIYNNSEKLNKVNYKHYRFLHIHLRYQRRAGASY